MILGMRYVANNRSKGKHRRQTWRAFRSAYVHAQRARTHAARLDARDDDAFLARNPPPRIGGDRQLSISVLNYQTAITHARAAQTNLRSSNEVPPKKRIDEPIFFANNEPALHTFRSTINQFATAPHRIPPTALSWKPFEAANNLVEKFSAAR